MQLFFNPSLNHRGATSATDGLSLALQWACCNLLCLMWGQPLVSSHRGHTSSPLLPKPRHVNPTHCPLQNIVESQLPAVYWLWERCLTPLPNLTVGKAAWEQRRFWGVLKRNNTNESVIKQKQKKSLPLHPKITKFMNHSSDDTDWFPNYSLLTSLGRNKDANNGPFGAISLGPVKGN